MPTSDPSTHLATATFERERQRRQWLEQVLGPQVGPLSAASADAGFRSYWRAPTAEGSVIVMDSPPELEDARPWLRIRALLVSGGVRVPDVLACDEAQGFVLLEDLGRDTLLQALDDDNADVVFDAAFAQLLKIQALAVPDDLPHYDEFLLQRELDLFPEWFLQRHLGLALNQDETATLARINRRLIECALAQPKVLVHRDFMPRNLMPAESGPAVIDFQGAVLGPIAYDPISLFRDAFISWPEERVDGWLRDYHRRAGHAGLPVPDWSRFCDDADWIGVQRHLKILGIFARLRHRDDKPHYLEDAPRFLDYLTLVAERHTELRDLGTLIEQRIRPALAMAGPA